MKNIFKILLIIFSFLLLSCAKEEPASVIEEQDIELQMLELYQKAYEDLLDGDVLYAAKKFNEAELIFPQSDWAPTAALMSAYAYYTQDYYSDSIYELQRYFKVYPKHKDHNYAHFLLAMCYYENIVDEKRDLEPLLNAKKEFEYVLANYPNTDFALDAKFKLDLIQDRLAGKEMYIGRHYLKAEKWIPAMNRFKNVVENYETTIYVQEAIHRLVEINYRLGMISESKKFAELLGYNYQSSDWYKATYKVFNKDYTYIEKKKLKLDEKRKKNILKRFKNKFKNLLD